MIFLKQVSKHHLMGAESVYIHVYDHIPYMGSVAERSKALVLGTSLFGGVGSNPTAATGFGTANQRSMTGPKGYSGGFCQMMSDFKISPKHTKLGQ